MTCPCFHLACHVGEAYHIKLQPMDDRQVWRETFPSRARSFVVEPSRAEPIKWRNSKPTAHVLCWHWLRFWHPHQRQTTRPNLWAHPNAPITMQWNFPDSYIPFFLFYLKLHKYINIFLQNKSTLAFSDWYTKNKQCDFSILERNFN